MAYTVVIVLHVNEHIQYKLLVLTLLRNYSMKLDQIEHIYTNTCL